MQFNNRYDAARQLIVPLGKYKNEQSVIFAVPRGGVPIGYYIARHYNLPLELLFTKKIGHPSNKEFAIGAVSMEDYIIDEYYNVPVSYIEKEIIKIREMLLNRYKHFVGDKHKPVEVKNKTVIIVDDGIATGHTILAAVKMMRRKNPKRIVVAVPVAPLETVNRMKENVDDFICLYAPKDFFGVGQFYADFSEVQEDEVIKLFKEANIFGTAADMQI
jgi:putative phosphoribosyl transferase